MGILRWLRYLPERILHPFRRRAAEAVVRRTGLPPSVLFVCQGNIYRSPYAGYRFLTLLPTALRMRMDVTSGGFVGPDRPSPDNAVACAGAHGVDLVPHRSSLLTLERTRNAALVVVMEEKQKRRIMTEFGLPDERVIILGDLDPDGIERRTIRDPWRQPDSVLQASYDRIDRCLIELVRGLPGARG